MRGGSLAAFATPEQLLQRAAGGVWQLVVSSNRFDDVRRTMTISGAVRKSDGVHIRVVASERPSIDATAVEPTLEDAFLFVMREGEPPPLIGAVA